MTLVSGDFRSYDDDRMVVRFTLMDDATEVLCAVSTDAMDRIEGKKRSGAAAREEQFFLLRATIEARAAQKVAAVEFEGSPPGVILRTIDFPPA
jgi:hypothetical protein